MEPGFVNIFGTANDNSRKKIFSDSTLPTKYQTSFEKPSTVGLNYTPDINTRSPNKNGSFMPLKNDVSIPANATASPSKGLGLSNIIWSPQDLNSGKQNGENFDKSQFGSPQTMTGNSVRNPDMSSLNMPKPKLFSPDSLNKSLFGNGKISVIPDQANERLSLRSPLFLEKDSPALLLQKETLDLTGLETKSANWQQRLIERGQRILELLQNEYNVMKYCRESYQKFNDGSREHKYQIQILLDTLLENQNITNIKEITQYLFPNITNISKKIHIYTAFGQEIQAQAATFKHDTSNLYYNQDDEVVDLDSTIIGLLGVIGKEQENILKHLEEHKLYLRQKPNSYESEECSHTLMIALKTASLVYQTAWDKISHILMVLGEIMERDARIISDNALNFKNQVDRFNDSKYELTQCIELNKKIIESDDEMERTILLLVNFFKVNESQNQITLNKPEDWREVLKQLKYKMMDKKQQLKEVKSGIKKVADPTIMKSAYFQKVRFIMRDQLEESVKKVEIRCDINKSIVEILEDLVELEKNLLMLYNLEDKLNEILLKSRPSNKEAITDMCANLNKLQADYGAIRKKIWNYTLNPQYQKYLGHLFGPFIMKLDQKIVIICQQSEKLLREKFRDEDIYQEIKDQDVPNYIDKFKKFCIEKLIPDPALNYSLSENIENTRKDLDSNGRRKLNKLEQLSRKAKEESVKNEIRSFSKTLEEILKILKIVADLFEAGIKIHDLNNTLLKFSMDMQNEDLKKLLNDTIDLIVQYNQTLIVYKDNAIAINQSQIISKASSQNIQPLNQGIPMTYSQTINPPNYQDRSSSSIKMNSMQVNQYPIANQQQQQQQSPVKSPNSLNQQNITFLAQLLGKKENPLPLLCSLAINQNEIFISIYRKVLNYFYKELKDISSADQVKYQKLLGDKHEKFYKDVTMELNRLPPQNREQIILFNECFKKWQYYIREINQNHDTADKEGKFLKIYSAFIEKFMKNNTSYTIEEYPELIKAIAKIIGSVSPNETKGEQGKNAYADLILIDQLLRSLADNSLNQVTAYVDFCDPIGNTVTLKSIFDVLDKGLKMIESERNGRLFYSKYNEFLIDWSGNIESLFLLIQKICKLMDGVKADFSLKVIKSGFKDIAEFYADFVRLYKLIASLHLENDPALSKFPSLKRRFSLISNIAQKYNITEDKINILNNFVKTYVSYENDSANLLFELNQLQDIGAYLIGPQNIENRNNLKKISKNFANTVENLRNFYQESLQITIIHQYKAMNSGINNINSAMIQTLQIAQSIVKAINSIVNSNDEHGDLVETAILKLEGDLSNLNTSENYFEILSVLKKLTSKYQNDNLKFDSYANPLQNMNR